jgi:hypothetical protein
MFNTYLCSTQWCFLIISLISCCFFSRCPAMAVPRNMSLLTNAMTKLAVYADPAALFPTTDLAIALGTVLGRGWCFIDGECLQSEAPCSDHIVSDVAGYIINEGFVIVQREQLQLRFIIQFNGPPGQLAQAVVANAELSHE